MQTEINKLNNRMEAANIDFVKLEKVLRDSFRNLMARQIILSCITFQEIDRNFIGLQRGEMAWPTSPKS